METLPILVNCTKCGTVARAETLEQGWALAGQHDAIYGELDTHQWAITRAEKAPPTPGSPPPKPSIFQQAISVVGLVVFCVLIVVLFSIVFQSASPNALNGCDGPCAGKQDQIDKEVPPQSIDLERDDP